MSARTRRRCFFDLFFPQSGRDLDHEAPDSVHHMVVHLYSSFFYLAWGNNGTQIDLSLKLFYTEKSGDSQFTVKYTVSIPCGFVLSRIKVDGVRR